MIGQSNTSKWNVQRDPENDRLLKCKIRIRLYFFIMRKKSLPSELKDKTPKNNVKTVKRIVKRKYNRFQYSENTLKEAINAVKNKAMSANKAAVEYKIPKGTLINKLGKII